MSVSLNRLSTTMVAVAVIAAALGLGTALGATPPTGMSAQAHRALVIRSQALNDLYGEPEVTSQYKAMVRAGRIRGEAMNRLAANDRIHGEAMNRLAKSGVLTAPPVPSDTVAGDGFDWTDFAIGLGAMFGFVLLAGALAGATMYARRGHARAHAA
jgi:hypothetical protein